MTTELLDWLLQATLATSAALLLVLALRQPLRRLSGAQAVRLLWILVPAALLAVSLPSRVVEVDHPAATLPGITVTATDAAPRAMATAPDAPADGAGTPFAWLVLWLAGIAAATAGMLAQQRRFQRALHPATAVEPDVLRAASPHAGPAAIGLLRPRVVLPADFERRYTPRQQQLVLAHEREHLRRGDVAVSALASALRCLFWFNPLVHLAAQRLRLDLELACDAAVVARFPHARRSYADAMVDTQLAVPGLPVGCHWQSSHPLRTRIAMIKHPAPSRTRATLGTALALALGTGTSLAAWAMQPADVRLRAAPAVPEAPAPAVAAPAAPASDAQPAVAPMPAARATQTPSAAPPAPAAAPVAPVARAVAPAAPAAMTADTPRPAAAPAAVPQPARAHAQPPPTFTIAPAPPAPLRGGGATAPRHPVPGLSHVDVPPPPAAPPAPPAPPAAAPPPPPAPPSAPTAPPVPVLEDGVTPPTLSSHRGVESPDRARRLGLDGEVAVRLTVDTRGRPRDIRIERSSDPLFDRAALRAAREMRFEPAQRDGHAIAMSILVPIRFTTVRTADTLADTGGPAYLRPSGLSKPRAEL